MNVVKLLNRLEDYANSLTLVNSVTTGDIYENLNGNPDVRYSNINIDISSVSRSENLVRYLIYIYYSDRLLEDKRNDLEIKSTAETVLHSIINYANEDLGEVKETYTVTFFVQLFADLLAGGYVDFYIDCPIELGDCMIDEYESEDTQLILRLIEAIRQYEEDNEELAELLRDILHRISGETV